MTLSLTCTLHTDNIFISFTACTDDLCLFSCAGSDSAVVYTAVRTEDINYEQTEMRSNRSGGKHALCSVQRKQGYFLKSFLFVKYKVCKQHEPGKHEEAKPSRSNRHTKSQ